VSSTQDALRWQVDRGLRGRCAIVSAEQTQGRGRHGRAWRSPSGGLYASLLLDPHPWLFAWLGLGIVRTLADYDIDAELFWPNDVLVRGRKIAGILVEVSGRCALAGIGINVSQAPLASATCMELESPRAVSLPELLGRLLRALGPRPAASIEQEYRAACATIGRWVRVEIQRGNRSERLEGIAQRVDRAGRLVVLGPEGDVAVSAGDCLHLLRPDPTQRTMDG
jgi:BirA family biotin operon repressor/biotin-[acetyl-CoA-carboxylase] ligase